jgi:hypothetical protein
MAFRDFRTRLRREAFEACSMTRGEDEEEDGGGGEEVVVVVVVEVVGQEEELGRWFIKRFVVGEVLARRWRG